MDQTRRLLVSHRCFVARDQQPAIEDDRRKDLNDAHRPGSVVTAGPGVIAVGEMRHQALIFNWTCDSVNVNLPS